MLALKVSGIALCNALSFKLIIYNILGRLYIIATPAANDCKKQQWFSLSPVDEQINKKIMKLIKFGFQQYIAVVGIIPYNYLGLP